MDRLEVADGFWSGLLDFLGNDKNSYSLCQYHCTWSLYRSVSNQYYRAKI